MPRRQILALTTCLLVAASASAEFPPITEEQRNMARVEWEPTAGTVILDKVGELWLLDESQNRFASRLVVTTRTKVLTEAGVQDAELAILHSGTFSLVDVEGRTVLPDGREVALGEDALFRRVLSERSELYATTVVFPAVEPGAILDLRYELRFPSIFFLEPWYFQDSLPTLRSEIRYQLTRDVGVMTWSQNPLPREIHSVQETGVRGPLLRVWMERLPAVPEEAQAFPFQDLSSRFLVLPTAMVEAGQKFLLFENWPTACGLLHDLVYGPFENRARKAKGKVRELTADATSTAETVDAIFRFVRDEIRTVRLTGVALWNDNVDTVLDEGEGGSADKALLLRKMLDVAGIEAGLVFVADRNKGRIDPQIPNPGWFDRVVVRATVDGRPTLLDPSSAGAVGYLPPEYEGMPALLFDRRSPQLVELAGKPFEENLRRATLELALDEEGRIAGAGRLRLEGHHAAAALAATDESAAARDWTVWLEERFPRFRVSDVAVETAPEALRATITWSLAQEDEAVLGDEASLQASRPLGPVEQIFEPVESRRSPALFAFPDRDELEVTLRWPEAWELSSAPEAVAVASSAGRFEADVDVAASERRAVYTRRFDVTQREHSGEAGYRALRDLFERAARHDAQELVLLRR